MGRPSHTLIRASGGQPADQMGNSEVGHLNLGGGRVIYQEFNRVSRSIKTGSFFSNRTLMDAVDLAKETDKALHLRLPAVPGGVRRHEEHLHVMVELAVGVASVGYICMPSSMAGTHSGEDRKLVPSLMVATSDLEPEMSVYEVTDIPGDSMPLSWRLRRSSLPWQV